MKILHRHVLTFPAKNEKEFLLLQKQMEILEKELGYPTARHYSPLFSAENKYSLIVQRIIDSDCFGKLTEERYRNKDIQKLEAERLNLLEWNRQELFYVDTGSKVPRWMRDLSSKPLSLDSFESQLPISELFAKGDGKMKVMLRHIQGVNKNKWADKVEQEKMSDLAELNAKYPIPLRYRSMCSPLHCHVRIHEREYESYAQMCDLDEKFFLSSTQADKKLWGEEQKRMDFIAWENGELYFVLD